MTDNLDSGFDAGVDLLTIMDEDGAEHQFEVADTAEIDGENYMALIPVFDQPEKLLEDSGQLVILKVVEEDGEEFLEEIQDDGEFDKVGDFFMDRLSDSFEFTDGE